MRWLIGSFGVFLILVHPSGASAQAEISQAELDAFIENSNSQYTDPGEPVDVEDVLYLAGKIGKTPDKAVVTYADVRNIPPKRAAAEAELIVAISNHFGSCLQGFDGSSCGLVENPELSARIRQVGFEDQSGEILRLAGIKFARISRYSWGRPATDQKEVARFLELIDGHPAFDNIMLGIYRYGREAEFLVPLLGRATPHSYAVMEIGGGYDASEIEKDTALVATALERLGHRSAHATYHAVLTRVLIGGLLQTGQYQEASQVYLEYRTKEALWVLPSIPEPQWYDQRMDKGFRELYAQLPDEEKRETRSSDRTYAEILRDRHRRRIAHIKLELAGALAASGDSHSAEELLNQLSTEDQKILGMQQREKIYFLRQAMNPGFDDDTIFRIFLNEADENIYEELPPLFADTIAVVTGQTPGWLDALARAEWAYRDLASKYLSNAGYKTMARYPISRPAFRESRRETGVYDFYSDQLGQAFAERVARYKQRMEAIESERKERNRVLNQEMTPTPIHVSERPVVFEERPLPERIAPFAPPARDEQGDADEETGQDTEDDEAGIPKELEFGTAACHRSHAHHLYGGRSGSLYRDSLTDTPAGLWPGCCGEAGEAIRRLLSCQCGMGIQQQVENPALRDLERKLDMGQIPASKDRRGVSGGLGKPLDHVN